MNIVQFGFFVGVIAIVYMCAVDTFTGLIPDKISIPFIVYSALFSFINPLTTPKTALISILITYLGFAIFALINKLGGGDVKLLTGMVALLGVYNFILVLFYACLMGILIALSKFAYSHLLKIDGRKSLRQTELRMGIAFNLSLLFLFITSEIHFPI